MAKLLKILARLLGGFIEWTLILFILFAFLIRTSTVQTYIAQEVTLYLSIELDAKVEVKKVAIVFFDRVALDGLLIEDQQGETLLSANRLHLNLDDINLKKKSYTIAEAKLSKGFIHIQRSKDNVFNHSFIKEYFSKEKKKKTKIKFALRHAELDNCEFQYDDHRKEQRETGMDYFHLRTKNISGKVTNLSFVDGIIAADISGLTAEEKCGFELKCFSASASVSSKGVLLNDVEIITEDSWIRSSKFNMLSDTYTSFKYFVDSVKFDGQIDASDVSLKEIAYFAYAFEGMDDRVRVSSEIKNKVTKLRLKNFDLKYKEKTRIQGKIELDDYRKLPEGFYHERLDNVYIDLKELVQLKLPKSVPERYITLSPEIERLEYIEGNKIYVDGNYQKFIFAANTFKTALGWAELNNGIQFSQHETHPSYTFNQSNITETGVYDFTIHEFNLGTYLANHDVGVVDGSFKLSGEIYSSSDIRFDKVAGDINIFEYLNYPYSDIVIKRGEFKHDKFDGRIEVNDDYLSLVYDGYVDFGGTHEMDFTVEIKDSDLDELKLTDRNSELLSNLEVKLSGNNLNSYSGSIAFNKFSYTLEEETLEVDDFMLKVDRNLPQGGDLFTFSGSAVNGEIRGDIELDQLVNNFHYQFSRIFPALYGEHAENYASNDQDDFTYQLQFDSPNNLVKLFYPNIYIAPGSRVKGYYIGKESRFALNMYSDSLEFHGMRLENVSFEQILGKDQILADYYAQSFIYSDSLRFDEVYFNTNGGQNNLQHRLTWEEHTNAPSDLSWDSEIKDSDHFGFVLNPSHFYIKDHKWDISQESSFTFEGDTVNVDHFKLTRNDQEILMNGKISDQNKHKLNFTVNDLELAEISPFITSDYPMSGTINLYGEVSNPFNNLGYEGNGKLTDFIVNGREVGDISMESYWQKEKQAIFTEGNLIFKDQESFTFNGDYYIFEEEDNLDFDLIFDYTDLEFTNAFMDPDVISEIRGFINGKIDLTGAPNMPLLDGEVELNGGSAFVDILGVHFGVDGIIEVDKYGFYINGIPVYDEDGNSGMLIGSVFHDNFTDFNFDLQFDLEPQAISTIPVFGEPDYSRFLVMSLPYDHDALYYGTGYVTGYANIFGYTDNLEITTDFKTMEGTELNIPMYGVGEIEEEDFITFGPKELDSTIEVVAPLFDLTGVHMDLNFEATPAAQVNIIFNEEIGDVITAKGSGDISITLDNLGDVQMQGTYEVQDGVYNFAMNPVSNSPFAVKQTFIIEEGGKISWTGDPYSAKLDLRTYYKLNTNLSEISGDTELGSTGGAHQPVYSYLDLSGTMIEPEIAFDITAPLADDIGRTLLERIKNDPDELSRQFFSLMLTRKFQPIAGSTSANGSAALDLITNQINSALSAISQDYLLKVDIDNDMLSGDHTYEFGISKGFLNDRLILSGSFGVENYGHEEIKDNGEISNGQLIGDLNLEYVINESGTFRVNIFNESTDKTIIQASEQGDFTQGAGLLYKEEFDTMQDFKLVQYLLDVFRKKENKRFPIRERRQQKAIPVEEPTQKNK